MQKFDAEILEVDFTHFEKFFSFHSLDIAQIALIINRIFSVISDQGIYRIKNFHFRKKNFESNM